MNPPHKNPTLAAEALQKLKDGNQRFSNDNPRNPRRDAARQRQTAESQNPFALVLGCADSRVSPTILFDQGVGDLFVIRVAGGVVDDAVLGSIQFGIEKLQIPLVVVLGHENCGAVTAALRTLEAREELPGPLGGITRRIWPALAGARASGEDDLEHAVIANSRHVAELIAAAEFMKRPVQQGKVRVVGGYYHLESGRVSWVF